MDRKIYTKLQAVKPDSGPFLFQLCNSLWRQDGALRLGLQLKSDAARYPLAASTAAELDPLRH
jgi:hypothetical protein